MAGTGGAVASASRAPARGGDPEKFKPAGYTTLPGASYRNQWWVTHNAHGAYMARGVHGQGIYIDPKAEMVIARYASHPAAGNAASEFWLGSGKSRGRGHLVTTVER